MRSYDAQTLRTRGRALQVPFRLSLDAAGDRRELVCTTILRNLPGKRLVCAAAWHRRQAVVAKIFLDASRAKRHFQRELQGVAALRAARIATPELVFQGTLADGQAPLLLFRWMEGFENLNDRLARAGTVDERLEVMRSVVASLARLHLAGLSQRDLHPGNFLLAGREVMIIDGADIASSSGGPLSRRRSLSNLALLFAQFYPRYDALVPELVDLYTSQRGWPPGSRIAARTIRGLQRWRAARQTQLLKKTRRSCTAYVARSSWRRFMAWDRAWYSPECGPLLADPDIAIANGQILKAGNTATVARVALGSRTVVVKRYNLKGIGHALHRCLRPSRAMASWQNAHRLRFLGIDTPRPLAVIEERWGFLRKRAYFVMEDLPGETIDRKIRTHRDNPGALTYYIHKLTVLLGQLAAARISHGDFKGTNFLVARGRLYLLDLDGMRVYRHRPTFKRAFRRDLARLERNWQDLPQVHRALSAMVRPGPDGFN